MFQVNFLSISAITISILSSLVYVGYYQLRAISAPRAISKTLATAALVVAANAGGVSLLYSGALALAALGDYVKSFRTERSLALAIAASAGMQILVCVWFARELWIGIEAPLVWIVGVCGITAGFVVLVWPRLGTRIATIVPYVICSLVLFSLGLGATPGRPLLMLGLTLYLISLLLLGIELLLFDDRLKLMRVIAPIIWITYYSGLLLMMIGGAE